MRHMSEYRSRGNYVDLLITVLFAIVVCSFGLCHLGASQSTALAEKLHLNRELSNLEGKYYAELPVFSLASFKSSEYQDDIESYINDHMPLRDEILLLNAGWQRALISLSASLHGFNLYPTFFGSSYAYDSTHDALYEILQDADERAIADYENAAHAFSAFAERHPELDCYFYRVDRLSSSSNNPTNSLMNNGVNTSFLTEHFFGRLRDIDVIDGLQESQEESLEVFFRSDHHWNGIGAYAAYVDMLAAMSPDAAPVEPVECVTISHPLFQGSCARSALYPVVNGDSISDYIIDSTNYIVKVEGEDADLHWLQHTSLIGEDGEWEVDPFYNRYSEWWHSDFSSIEIGNSSSASEKNLLIIRDSFSSPLERYFADYYRNVYVLDPRYSKVTVEEFLLDHSVDDVLFLMGSTTFPTEDVIAWMEST